MNGIYKTLTDCAELANVIEATDSGYVSLDRSDRNDLKQKLIERLEAVLDQLRNA